MSQVENIKSLVASLEEGGERGRHIAGAAFILWLVPSMGVLVKYTGMIGLVLSALVAVKAIAAFTAHLLRHAPDASYRWLIVAGGLTVLMFAVLYPLAHSGLFGPGSDRDDALNVAVRALVALQDPYSVTSIFGNVPTPMPGALLLALPFYLIGNSAFQNIFWVVTFFWWASRRFEKTTPALWLGLIFIVGCPASLRDLVTGGDYLVNALYVSIAIDLVFCSLREEQRAYRFATAIFLCFAISSRPIYALAVPVLAGTIVQYAGWRSLLGFLLVIGFGCGLLIGPIYLYDPDHFPTVHIAMKVADMPPWLHAWLVLPAIGAFVGCFSFFIPMNRARIFGLMALALLPVLYVAVIYRTTISVLGAIAMTEYLLPVSIFGAIWLTEAFAVCRNRLHPSAA